jgi:hypothetical protein
LEIFELPVEHGRAVQRVVSPNVPVLVYLFLQDVRLSDLEIFELPVEHGREHGRAVQRVVSPNVPVLVSPLLLQRPVGLELEKLYN